ncbi:transcription factor IIIA [Hyperolius riggenbachi]|uniref:transcription factor IIIA n=1 Tax=Hyperolius riggenbachi TaxID=752182 RepID=UPI0035A2FC4C
MAVSVIPRAGGVTLAEPVQCGRSMGEKALPAVYKRYICSFPDCSAAYNKSWKLQAHLCKHTGEKPFPCNYEGCAKSFVSLFHLTRHSMVHTGERPCKCDAADCELRFTTKSTMKKHYQRAHVSPSVLYVCHFVDCGKSFKKHNQLKVHQYIHTNQQPFVCTHEGCNKSYPTPSKLKRHEKVHAGYPCRKNSSCQFVGKTWTDYLKHLATDHSETVTCELCNREFKRRWHLKEHKRTHDEERLVLRCPREGCERTYTKKFNLQSHILSFHEELRPFACQQPGCDKSFAMKQSLDRHANTHDPQKKKMEKPQRPRRSLASRLSGYNPKKSSKKKSMQATDPSSVIQNDPNSGLPEPPLQNLSIQ